MQKGPGLYPYFILCHWNHWLKKDWLIDSFSQCWNLLTFAAWSPDRSLPNRWPKLLEWTESADERSSEQQGSQSTRNLHLHFSLHPLSNSNKLNKLDRLQVSGLSALRLGSPVSPLGLSAEVDFEAELVVACTRSLCILLATVHCCASPSNTPFLCFRRVSDTYRVIFEVFFDVVFLWQVRGAAVPVFPCRIVLIWIIIKVLFKYWRYVNSKMTYHPLLGRTVL